MRKIIILLLMISPLFGQPIQQERSPYFEKTTTEYKFCYVCNDNRMIRSFVNDSKEQRQNVKLKYGCDIVTKVRYCR